MKQQALFIVILLVGVVFAIGVIVGNAWKTSESSGVSKVLRQSELDTESFLVEQELFESFETNCALAEKRLGSLGGELWKLGKVLGAPDAKVQLGEEDYSLLKRKYHLMQIRTYILNKKLQSDCASKADVILFYFKQGDALSEQQGQILDELVAEYNLNVFAIEYKYSKELAFLEDYYEISSTPTLVVNYKNVLPTLATKEQLTPLFYG